MQGTSRAPNGETYPIYSMYVWYIYLQNWVIFRANVDKYSIHGAYGYGFCYEKSVVYPLVNVNKQRWKDPPCFFHGFFQRFRLGHVVFLLLGLLLLELALPVVVSGPLWLDPAAFVLSNSAELLPNLVPAWWVLAEFLWCSVRTVSTPPRPCQLANCFNVILPGRVSFEIPEVNRDVHGKIIYPAW